MKTLPALRRVDVGSPDQVRAGLTALGYQSDVAGSPVDTLFFQFAADFADGTAMTGYIDRVAWMNHALPALTGIDWFSVDDKVLAQLVSATPFTLNLHQQHAGLSQIRIVAWQRDPDQLGGWPTVTGPAGKIIITGLRCGAVQRPMNAEPAQKLWLPLAFVLGSSGLRLQTLAMIRIGDVLLIEHPMKYIRTHDRALFKFEFNEEVIMIHPNDDEVSALAAQVSQPHPSGDLNSLPVELSFILFEKMVTLGELSAMAPGEVLSLPQNTLMDVEIRANARCFARGELIQLSDGRLGVEIRKIWP